VARNTVLVIDDDRDFREAVAVVLEDMGVKVLEAPDCAEGVALLERERERVRLVLLDYWMPGMTPVACMGALKACADGDIDIILVTAAATPAKYAAELGLARYLKKPFAIEQLRGVVARSLGSPRTTAAR
jgi:two-component system, OmpR family, response regulator VanR